MKQKKSYWRYWQWIVAVIIAYLFIYNVLLNNTLQIPMSIEWMEQHQGKMEMRYNDLEYVVKETALAIFHQFSLFSGGPIHNRYGWATIIVTVSALFWSSLFSFIIAPKGFRLKEGTLVQHMVFSAVIASISLFQILQSLRNDPEYFFWLLWFAIVLCFLASRAYYRVINGNRTLQEEIVFHLPWIIGLIIPHVIWFEPFHSMNQGTPFELPFSGYSVNSYTILMNTVVFIITLGFIPGIKHEIKKECKS